MSPVQVMEVARKYAVLLDKRGATPIRNPDAQTLPDKFNHLRWMCDEICDMLLSIDNSVEKAELKAGRWLGFIQGALMVTDVLTIEEMKSDNRSR